jgi:hypothetical protein
MQELHVHPKKKIKKNGAWKRLVWTPIYMITSLKDSRILSQYCDEDFLLVPPLFKSHFGSGSVPRYILLSFYLQLIEVYLYEYEYTATTVDWKVGMG